MFTARRLRNLLEEPRIGPARRKSTNSFSEGKFSMLYERGVSDDLLTLGIAKGVHQSWVSANV